MMRKRQRKLGTGPHTLHMGQRDGMEWGRGTNLSFDPTDFSLGQKGRLMNPSTGVFQQPHRTVESQTGQEICLCENRLFKN